MISYLTSNPLLFVVYLLALFVAVTVHEFSHAKAADALGDPTPRLHGRISFNPLVHIDTIGLLFLLFFGFGWGKPVTFDPYNLKSPRRDAALISLAGPGSNFVLALVLAIALRLFIFFKLSFLSTIGTALFIPVIYLNIILGVFNLLPIHPLDGFKIVGGILSEDRAREWYQLERYGILFLILLLLPIGGGSALSSIIIPIINAVLGVLLPPGVTGGIL